MAVVAALFLTSATAHGQLQMAAAGSGSLLVWPKVIADGTRDTVIELLNLGNGTVNATCYYVRGDDGSCGVTNFAVTLGKQQPTHWQASAGRSMAALDPECTPTVNQCNGAGTDPGAVPAVAPGFQGALFCFETDGSGAPLAGNHLTGWGTLSANGSADVSRYGAVAFQADASAFLPSDVLNLDGTEFAACPAAWSVNHAVDGSFDPLVGDTSSITNRLTIVPCTQDWLNQVPTTASLQFSLTDDLGQTFTASTTVSCWADLALSDIDSRFGFATLGSFSARTTVSSDPGVALLHEDVRTPYVEAAPTTSIVDPHHAGTRAGVGGDQITLPSTVLIGRPVK